MAACVGGKVEGTQNDELIRPFLVEEIREAVFQLPATKSPGPDGFMAAVFQDHWEVWGMILSAWCMPSIISEGCCKRLTIPILC